MSLNFSVATKVLKTYEYEEEVIVMLKIQSKEEPKKERAPIDVVCVIDKSGSMAGSPFRLVQDTMDFFIAQLNENDKLSVISFDDEVFTNLKLTKMNESGKRRASYCCERMKTGRTTNIGDALKQAIKEIQNCNSNSKVKSIFLFSDGCPNVGVKTTEGLINLIPGGKKDYTINTFGFSRDHDANMLSSIADKGNGNYTFISNKEDITLAFANVLAGTMSIVAQNVKLQVKVEETMKVKIEELYSKVIGGLKLEKIEKDMQYGEEKFFTFKLTKPKDLELEKVLKFVVGYESILKDEYIKNEIDLKVVENDAKKIDEQINRMTAINALKESLNSEKKEDKIESLKNALKIISDSISKDTSFTKSLIAELEKCLENVEDTRSHYVVATLGSYLHQRNNNYKNENYMTERRIEMIRKMKNREKNPKCNNCGSSEHFAKHCKVPQMCHNCKSFDHLFSNCPLKEKCHHCGGEGHKISNCPKIKCFKCNKYGHMSDNCPEAKGPKKCFKCGRSDHLAENCTYSKDKCYKCGEFGHISKFCPNKRRRRTGKGLKCFKCGKTGHKRSECPN